MPTPKKEEFEVSTIGQVILDPPESKKEGISGPVLPDSFALMKDKYIIVQYKQNKQIQVFTIPEKQSPGLHNSLQGPESRQSAPYFVLDNAISRNGKSFCIYDKYIAIRNLKQKCFEVVDIEEKKTVVSFAYEDIWYYNNYHVLGHVFVFPHYMKVTFFDADNSFRKLESKGVDFDWYKNDDKDAGNLLS
jgi:hypothetical protein